MALLIHWFMGVYSPVIPWLRGFHSFITLVIRNNSLNTLATGDYFAKGDYFLSMPGLKGLPSLNTWDKGNNSLFKPWLRGDNLSPKQRKES
jgi:hypothetical protein